MNRLFFKNFFFFCGLSTILLFPADLPKNIVKKNAKRILPQASLKNETQQKWQIDLKNPKYVDGVLSTREGGIIAGENLRIQAHIIDYTHQEKNNQLVHTVYAEKDLLVQWHGHIYTGEKFYYDFTTKSGVINKGKTFVSFCYVGGNEIYLNCDGSYLIKNATLTTCENKDSSWEIQAKEILISNNSLLSSSALYFRYFRFPTFWFPSFHVNLKKFFSSPLFKTYFDWDRSSGPKAGLRYQLYSGDDFAIYARAEYRYSFGFGGALETEYAPSHKNILFQTKNYLATDMVPNDPRKKRRYRIEGLYHQVSQSKKTEFELMWDKYSDINMPNDFKTDDFEISTAQQTKLTLFHEENNFLTNFKVRPRLNPFESLRQDLPYLLMVSRPLQLPGSFINQNTLKLAYIDYVYSHNLIHKLSDRTGCRIEFSPTFYRPINISALHITPLVQGDGIFYSHTPDQRGAAFLGSLHYLLDCSMRFKRLFSHQNLEHAFEPYVKLEGWTRPSLNLDHHFIYSIQDGFYHINQLSLGVKNFFYSQKNQNDGYFPTYFANFYVNAFLPDEKLSKTIPKLYLDFEWNLPSLRLRFDNAYNFEKNQIEYFNLQTALTISEDVACKFEFRHRSKTAWRKADPENFILDVARREHDLLRSPLSDRRNTFLTHWFFRLTPFWSCHIESHHGWHRLHEHPYNEVKVDLYTTLSAFWRIKLSYQHTQWDDRFAFDYELLKM